MTRHLQGKKVSANSQVVATILRCVQDLRALETRSLEAKVARRVPPLAQRVISSGHEDTPSGWANKKTN